MGELMHEQAGNLALGQQRLMEIARALAADPTLLLLDEPAAGLRLKEKQGLADVLRQLRDEGLSILLVEHDMDLVMGLVDRVVVMEFGTKLIEGTPDEVQASAAVRRRISAPSTETSDGRAPLERQRPPRRLRPRRGPARPDPSPRAPATSSP